MKKILLSLIFMVGLALSASAQLTMLSSFNLPSDTATDTGTAFLSLRSPGAKQTVTIQVNVLEISGTTAGTLTLMGSLDGVNYKAALSGETSTAIPTFTALDVATVQPFIWRVTNSPYLYYRVSYTGNGTMAASITAKLLAH